MSIELARLKEDIVKSLDIKLFYESVLEERVTSIDHSGWTNRFLCPIHNDTRTPNFFFNAHTGGFKCHACGAGGSIFDFWLYTNGYSPDDKSSMQHALVALANEAKISIDKWRQTDGSAYKDIDPEKAEKYELASKKIVKYNKAKVHDESHEKISDEIVDEFVSALNASHVKYLSSTRGLRLPAIRACKIGWNERWFYKDRETAKISYGRFTIPVFNADGECRNIRGYTPKTLPQYKMVNYVQNANKPDEVRHGSPPRLFNLHKALNESWKHIVICEGEFDAILLTQELHDAGFTTWGAVSGTHGANTFEPEWLPYFHGKDVYICMDCDPEGKLASANIATKHFLPGIRGGLYNSVKIIDLPLDGTKEYKDITDFFMKSEGTIDAFIRMCDSAYPLIAGGVDSDEASVEPIQVNSFVDAILNKKYIDTRITVPLTISGSSTKIYHAIHQFEVVGCPQKEAGTCCQQDAGIQTIPYGHPLLIASCMQREENNLRQIAAHACKHHQRCTIKPVSRVVMTEHFAHQVVERLTAQEVDGHFVNAQELLTVPVYVLQPKDGQIYPPQNYLATGYIRTHPNTSASTMCIERLEPLEEEWTSFDSVQPANISILKNLRDNFTLDDIVNELTTHVTRIYEADEILYAILLTYFSPLGFIFNGTLMRGWLNAAIIGDSGTGKSATFVRLSDWLGVGDLFSALSGTRTGLLYAVKQRQSEWHISVGAYVRANGKILAVDETQEMEAEEIKKMAIAMDTGFLNIERVASGGYQTKTRTLFMMNPKKANGVAATVSEFMYGAECLRYCFDAMFIRRLDLAVFTTGNRKYDFYNQTVSEESVPKLTPLMMKTLLFWIWTRSINQIKWTQTATDLCLQKATELSEIYGYVDVVPLVCPQDFRLNLARLSVACATLSCSFSDDMQELIVKDEHVEYMSLFIQLVYNSPACDLAMMSLSHKQKNTIDGDEEKVKGMLMARIERDAKSGNPDIRVRKPFLQMLLMIEAIEFLQKRDFTDQLGVSQRWAGDRLTALLANNLIERKKHGYTRTRRFMIFMRQWRQDPEVAKMLSEVYTAICDSEAIDDIGERVDEYTNSSIGDVSSYSDPMEMML